MKQGNKLPKHKGDICVIVCTDEIGQYSGQGVFTGVVEHWGTENEPCTVYQFEVGKEERIFISMEHDVILAIGK